jgi:predicted transcriptional regulator
LISRERESFMPKNPADVTETELAILQVLWDSGPIDVRAIVEAVYGRHSVSLHATVKSLLDRLAEKNYVKCDRSQFAHQYWATVDRETYVGRVLQRLADSHFSGSLAPMLLTLVEHCKLSRKDRESIRRIVDGIH